MKRLPFLVLLIASPAFAHFELDAPASRSEQDGLGGPQKSEPCGESDVTQGADDSVPTNQVTTLMEGSTFDVQVTEKIFHPGHYRVSLAQDIASLPNDPTVTPGTTPCGSTTIETNPTLPLLADGLLVHTSQFSGMQTAQVSLPAGMTCTHCIVQVLEFMSNHPLNNPGGCWYHHCAVVDIVANAPDAGAQPGDDAGVVNPTPDAGGCCRSGGGSPLGDVVAMFTIGGILLRRRRA
jgi:hypothetical protein